jgi:hypothetical protein
MKHAIEIDSIEMLSSLLLEATQFSLKEVQAYFLKQSKQVLWWLM